MSDQGSRVLYLVACGGHAAGQLDEFIERLQARSWDLWVIASPSALPFMDVSRLEALTGHVLRSAHRQPDEPNVLPDPDAVVVIPATFNTINKWASGISDTLALGVLNEAVGRGIPILAVPTINAALAKHPALTSSIATLRSWGVRVLFAQERHSSPPPGQGLDATDFFSWTDVEGNIGEMSTAIARS